MKKIIGNKLFIIGIIIIVLGLIIGGYYVFTQFYTKSKLKNQNITSKVEKKKDIKEEKKNIIYH